MNRTIVRLANLTDANPAKGVKMHVHVSLLDVKAVSLVNRIVHVKHSVNLLAPVLFPVRRFLWQTVYGSLLKQYK